MQINKIHHGECLELMKQMDSNSVDTIITDPPYGLSFMGKKWDYDVPSVDVWKECLRVLKPGGTALIFAGSRTQHRMAVNVEDAGFILKDCIMWLYGSGFPKATDMSKQLDKGYERKIIGKKKGGVPSLSWKKDGRKNPIQNYDNNFTIPTTPEAKLWNGWKSHGLKPAYEPILVAMKPNDGSYAQNALKHGVAGLNIDGGRIESNDKVLCHKAKGGFTGDAYDFKGRQYTNLGRFPANVILDEESAKMLDEQSGSLPNNFRANGGKSKNNSAFFGNAKSEREGIPYNDSGGASRFFYCAKASKAERNKGCENLEEKKVESDFGSNGIGRKRSERIHPIMGNNHPTVKPLKLMEYLCTLTKTPTGGIVLDPYAGSGTTLIAAVNTNRDFIGFECEEDYCEIARCRLKEAMKQQKLR